MFHVAILGDMPYQGPTDTKGDSIQRAYELVLNRLSDSDADFIVHIGDITRAECTDSVYSLRLREFNAVRKPLFYTFGDNEWTDCGGTGKDPIERLATLRQIFTLGDRSLGRQSMPLLRQSGTPQFAKFRENVRWTHRGVTFLTIHATGSNNNRGSDTITAPEEFRERNAANLAWLRAGFDAAAGSRAVVVFTQANPGLNGPGTRYGNRPRPDGFAELLDEFQRLAEQFRKPVALVHGDTHYFRFDQPFITRGTGLIVENIFRAETFGSPNFHALRMTIDSANPNLFRFEPILVPKGP